MRKSQKEQVENFIKLLGQAQDELQKSIRKRSFSDAADLVTECQGGAIALGNLIERMEGEGNAMIPLLEAYCEWLYQMHEGITNDNLPQVNQAHKRLHKIFTEIKNNVHKFIKVKKAAVFLPYKASMWDSLESVWRAAKEDPDCEAYVIPIPYYDKNQDGSFGEMHYEKDWYPEYVPITRYDAFDFEKIHPDMIFIHNPYDACNYVTSVPPFFYAENLKKYTDTLIYIPYFVLNEIDSADETAVEKIKHFVLTAGVLHSDMVIVQSEEMRQCYIKSLTKAAGQNTRKIWEKKILGLGSPKFDKVIGMKKEEAEVPEEWKERIRRENGECKKIVLYNTGVSALLEHGENMLRKIQNVFGVFKEKREEVTLWWRPHPLLEAAISSMRPRLWEEYQKLACQYKKEGWGIYDDSADLSRAVALCDGYYGDLSSVVCLCRKAAKVILLQNVEMREGTNTGKVEKMKLYGMVEAGERIFFPSLTFNALVELDKRTGKIIKLHRFLPDGVRKSYLYSTACKVGNEIILVPNNSARIAVFNLETQNMAYADLDMKKIGCDDTCFRCAYAYQNFVYMFPSKARCILKFNVETRKISYMDIGTTLEAGKAYFRQDYAVAKGRIYVPFAELNQIYSMDLRTQEAQIFTLDTEGGFSTICYLGGRFYLSSWKRFEVIEWDGKSAQVKKYCDFPEGIEKKQYTFAFGAVLDQQIIYFPQQCNMILSFDTLTKQMKCLRKVEGWQEQSLITYGGQESAGGGYFVISDEISLIRSAEDVTAGNVYLKIDSAYNKTMIWRYIGKEQGNFYREEEQNLGNFLEILGAREEDQRTGGNLCGEEIYRRGSKWYRS